MDTLLSKYELLENRERIIHNLDTYDRRLIDGRITGCGKCVGYCRFNGHPGFLTRDLQKKHDCLEKGCNYFIPKEKTQSIKSDNKHATLLCDTARKTLSHLEYMKVVRAVKSNCDKWYLDFVTISNDMSYTDYLSTIEELTGSSLEFRMMNWPYEKVVSYIFSLN